jgi:Zn-dependent oligopeptidase
LTVPPPKNTHRPPTRRPPFPQRVVDLQLRDLQLGGVALSAQDRGRFNEIQQELAKVGGKP